MEDKNRWKFYQIVLLFAGLGIIAPPAVLFVGGYLGWGGDWLIAFWPSIVILLADHVRPVRPWTWIEDVKRWTIAIGANVVLYALVGTIIWSVLATVRRLRTNPNQDATTIHPA